MQKIKKFPISILNVKEINSFNLILIKFQFFNMFKNFYKIYKLNFITIDRTGGLVIGQNWMSNLQR